jgi:fatty acid desaturase
MEWLSHDCGHGGVVDRLTVDAYYGMKLCTPILLGEASKKNWMANHFQKNSKTQNGHIP